MSMRSLMEAVGQFYYHVTLTSNLPNIMKVGLEPRIGPLSTVAGESKPTIYLFFNLGAVEEALMNWLGEYLPEDQPLSLLKVILPPGTKSKKGENEFGYEKLVFTVIPPECIEVLTKDIDTFDFED